jgi:hypothetical protein
MIKRTFKESRESSGALVHPESWSGRALQLLQSEEPSTPIGDMFVDNPEMPHWINREVLSNQYRTDEEVTRVALGIIEEHRPDVMMVFLPGIDRISHWLWGNLEPDELYPEPLRPTPEAKAGGAAALRRYYVYTDALIGELMKGYGPDDLILVISDHGFEAEVSMMLLTGGHESPAALDGVIFARGRGIPKGADVGEVNVFQVAPSVLAWLGIPLARDMPAGPMAFLELPPPLRVASYDGISIERHEATASGHEAEIVEHLEALGYLDAEDAEADERSRESAGDGSAARE